MRVTSTSIVVYGLLFLYSPVPMFISISSLRAWPCHLCSRRRSGSDERDEDNRIGFGGCVGVSVEFHWSWDGEAGEGDCDPDVDDEEGLAM
ncbi:hypothetical protein F2Q70_00039555 [Brassica cretica]|uniref:Uncharacterized protein n=1 Tax=Brassica cretica TaxID=69181 RepID=A0A8S9K8M7_BRACR|nr:hypothetical protein F2Q70_00039555 [Brassica cretica]